MSGVRGQGPSWRGALLILRRPVGPCASAAASADQLYAKFHAILHAARADWSALATGALHCPAYLRRRTTTRAGAIGVQTIVRMDGLPGSGGPAPVPPLAVPPPPHPPPTPPHATPPPPRP